MPRSSSPPKGWWRVGLFGKTDTIALTGARACSFVCDWPQIAESSACKRAFVRHLGDCPKSYRPSEGRTGHLNDEQQHNNHCWCICATIQACMARIGCPISPKKGHPTSKRGTRNRHRKSLFYNGLRHAGASGAPSAPFVTLILYNNTHNNLKALYITSLLQL